MKRFWAILLCILFFAPPVVAKVGVPGLVKVRESDSNPSVWTYEIIVDNNALTDNGDGTVTLDLSGAAGGSAITLDIGNDGSDQSTDLSEISISGDTNTIFSEATADNLLIDVSQNWPTADEADTLSTALTHELGGLEADVSAYSGLIAISGGSTSEVDALAELNAQIADATLLDDGAIADSTAIGLTTADNYSNFGDGDDDSLNEMFEAIDAAITSGDAFTVKVDAGATAGYIGAANNDGVLRTDGTVVTYSDGGDYVTIGAHAYLQDIAGITAAQGDVIYFDGTDWVNLGPGTSGQYLQTQGAGANPQWASSNVSGDIEDVGDVSSGAAFTADGAGNTLYFEGSTANAYEIILTGADPGADVTITLPAETGTALLSDGTNTDNAILRSDGTGSLAQTSGVTIDDSNNVDIPGTLETGSGNHALTNAAGLIDGEKIQADTIDDDSIDFSDVTLADLTFDVGSVSTTEFGYLNGVTSAIQTQLDARCLESVFGDGIEADDLELSGTTLQLAAEVPHTDAADTISADWEWQDGIAQSFGNDNDFELSYDTDLSDDDAGDNDFAAATFSTAGMKLNANSASDAIILLNNAGTGSTKLYVDELVTNTITGAGTGDSYIQLANNSGGLAPSGYRIYFETDGTDVLSYSLDGSEKRVANLEDAQTISGIKTFSSRQVLQGDADVGDASNAGSLRVYDGSDHYMDIQTEALSANRTWQFPDGVGSANQAFLSDGDGTFSWGNPSASPAGADTQVQFNNSGSTGADAGFTFNATTDALTLGEDGQDGSIILYNESGGTDYNLTLQPGTQSAAATITFPGATGTLATLGNAETITGTKTFTAAQAFDEDVDIDLDANDEQLDITSTATDYAAGSGIVHVYDDSTGQTNASYMLRLAREADGDAQDHFILCEDNSTGAAGNGDDMFKVDSGGAVTATGNVTAANLLISDTGTIGSASDTDAMSIAADGDVDVVNDFTAGTITSDAALTATTNVVIGDAGNIGSASDTDAIAISAGGEVTLSQELQAGAGIDVSGGTLVVGTISGTMTDGTASWNGSTQALTGFATFETDAAEINGAITGENDETWANSTDGFWVSNGGILIPDAGNIGSASDTDAIAIAANGEVTLSQELQAGAGIDVSGGTLVLAADEIESADIDDDGNFTDWTGNWTFNTGTFTLGNGATISDGQTLTFDESASDPDDADVTMSAADGVLTIAAANGANNEDITFDFDATADTIGISTSTSASTIAFTNFDTMTLAAADDPYVVFDPSTASESEWWIGPNHDSVGDDNDSMEIRQSATPGTNVEFEIEPDADVIIGSGADADTTITIDNDDTDGVIQRMADEKTWEFNNIMAVTPQTYALDSVADNTDITLGTEITSSIVIFTEDNDSDACELDLQDGNVAGQMLVLIGGTGIDSDDTVTIDTTTDSTCTGCLTVTMDEPGDTFTLIWTGSTWATISSSEAP